MTKHKLDQEVEDILQHFGIKGMKWGVKRTDEQIAADEGAGGGGGGEGEPDESLIEETLEAMSEKLKDISDSLKKKGKALMDKIFGGDMKPMKGKDKENFMKGFKKGIEASNAADKKNKLSPSERRRAEGKAQLQKEIDSVVKSLEKQGYKKHAKPKKEKQTVSYKKDGTKVIKTKNSTTTVKAGASDAEIKKEVAAFKKRAKKQEEQNKKLKKK